MDVVGIHNFPSDSLLFFRHFFYLFSGCLWLPRAPSLSLSLCCVTISSYDSYFLDRWIHSLAMCASGEVSTHIFCSIENKQKKKENEKKYDEAQCRRTILKKRVYVCSHSEKFHIAHSRVAAKKKLITIIHTFIMFNVDNAGKSRRMSPKQN